jgi:hypothetical protein
MTKATSDPYKPYSPRTQLALGLALAAGFIGVQIAALLAQGQPAICACGHVDLWHANPSGPETSQHLTDWYSLSHLIHGFIFYLVLWLIAPRMSFALRLAIAIGIEAAWEILENTPLIVERYRQTALARGYSGDSVINSLSDTAAATLGFILARILPVWSSIVLVIALELFAAYVIRDNLTLNIVQLLFPSETISNWQAGN